MAANFEKRRYPRRPLRLPVRLKIATYHDFIQQYVTDISAGGLFIATPTPYPLGSEVEVEFYLEKEKRYFFKIRGEVNRLSENPLGMAIVFNEIEESSQKQLEEILQQFGN